MHYIIHHTIDIDPQIQTCLLATEAGIPCAPDCDTCAASKHTLTQADLDEAYTTLKLGDLKARILTLAQDNEDLRSWKESAMSLLNDLDFQKMGKLMGLTLGDRVIPNIIPYLEFINKVRAAQTTTIHKYQNRIIEMQKVVDAAVELNKEAGYLHPYSVAVSNKIDDLQRAVLDWFKVIDGPAQKV